MFIQKGDVLTYINEPEKEIKVMWKNTIYINYSSKLFNVCQKVLYQNMKHT